MKTNDDDLPADWKKKMLQKIAADWKKKKWTKLNTLTDVAAKVYDEEQRAKKGKAKIVYEEESEDEEDESKKRFFRKKPSPPFVTRRYPLYPFENLNGASTSRSSSSSSSRFRFKQILCDWRTNRINLRLSPYSSSFREDYKITADSEMKNPNSQSESHSVQDRKRTGGGLKKSEVARFNAGVKRRRIGFQLNGAEDARLLFGMTLIANDVKSHYFLIPFKTLIRNDFLTPVEWRIIQGQGQKGKFDDGKPGIGAILVNEKCEKWGVLLEKKMNSEDIDGNYVALTCGWNDFVNANGLRADDKISLWAFRYHGNGILCFVLVVTYSS